MRTVHYSTVDFRFNAHLLMNYILKVEKIAITCVEITTKVSNPELKLRQLFGFLIYFRLVINQKINIS